MVAGAADGVVVGWAVPARTAPSDGEALVVGWPVPARTDPREGEALGDGAESPGLAAAAGVTGA